MCEQKRYGRLILTGTELLLVADIFYIATIILGTIPTSGGQLVHFFLKKKVCLLSVVLLPLGDISCFRSNRYRSTFCR